LENDGMLHSASNNKAEILNAQFKSAYTQEDLTNLPDVGRNTIPKLPEIRVVEKGFPNFPSSFVLFVDNFPYFSCDPGVSLF
jgi:hypothetical protein